MTKLVFLLEERSMRACLEGLLPRLLPEVEPVLIPHDGKTDLEKSVPRKLKAWREPGVGFVIVRDQDSSDCVEAKRRLLRAVEESGRHPSQVLVRIACRELESWFLGDLKALATAFEEPRLSALEGREKYREPDLLANAAEELSKLIPEYTKVLGARTIGPHLSLDSSNRSHSFQVFLAGVRRMAGLSQPRTTLFET